LTFPGYAGVNSATTVNKCHEDELKICADNAEPLIKEEALIVPDTRKSVDRVCKLVFQNFYAA